MPAPAPARGPALDRVAFARDVLRAEADALRTVADRLGPSFEACVETLYRCRGRVAVTGVGKSADVGRKIAATFNSTGTRAYVLDVTAAMHGDLGMVAPDDAALLLSHSGESEELLRLLWPLKAAAAAVLAITGNTAGTLARTADAAVVYGPLAEACPNALAPSTSTTAMLALGDALAFTLSELRQFGPDDFAKYHPAGSLGRKLATVESHMRRGAELRIASAGETVREVFARVRHEGRRTGAIILTDAAGRLAGLFTDSDLARLFEGRSDSAFDLPIARVMTTAPVTIAPTARLTDAVEVLRARKISELPVVDADTRPVGMLDITDLIGLEPPAGAAAYRPPLRLFDRITA
jgi:arabinose-5-phosphate isomerase